MRIYSNSQLYRSNWRNTVMKTIKPSAIFAKQERLAWLSDKIKAYENEREALSVELEGLDVAKVLQAEISRNQELLAKLKKA